MPRTYYRPDPKSNEPVMDIDTSIGLVPYMLNINHAGVHAVYLIAGMQLGYSMHFPITDDERRAVEIKILHYIMYNYDDVAEKDDKFMLLLNNQLIRTKYQAFRDKTQMLPRQLANQKQRKEFEMAIIPEILRLEELIYAQLYGKGNAEIAPAV